jgi:hypothetical protein
MSEKDQSISFTPDPTDAGIRDPNDPRFPYPRGPGFPDPHTLFQKRFVGTSETGSLQEALNQAIGYGESSLEGADQMFTWQVLMVRGVKGGIAGFRKLTVEIEISDGKPDVIY